MGSCLTTIASDGPSLMRQSSDNHRGRAISLTIWKMGQKFSVSDGRKAYDLSAILCSHSGWPQGLRFQMAERLTNLLDGRKPYDSAAQQQVKGESPGVAEEGIVAILFSCCCCVLLLVCVSSR